MVKGSVTIVNKSGLHARPASMFVKTAQTFHCHMTVSCKGNTYDAKSILGILSACIAKGAEIELACDGPDEEAALKQCLALIESGLGEVQD